MSTNIILGAKLGQPVTSTVCVEIWLKRLKILIRYWKDQNNDTYTQSDHLAGIHVKTTQV